MGTIPIRRFGRAVVDQKIQSQTKIVRSTVAIQERADFFLPDNGTYAMMIYIFCVPLMNLHRNSIRISSDQRPSQPDS